MKAMALTGPGRMDIIEVPAPVICADTDVLLKVEMVGVCGSDVHYYETGQIGSQVVKYPFILGHECAAVVEEIGSGVKDISVGERVVIEPAIVCHKCDQCRLGRENTCRNLKFLGCPGQISGCLCEYIVMPQECCFAVGENLSLEQSVLCEPLAIGLYSVKQAELKTGCDIAVLGTGPIGLSCIVMANKAGIRSCYATDKVDRRLDIAVEAGSVGLNPQNSNIVEQILKQVPLGVDAVFECAGQQETIDQAVELLKPGGRLILIGIPRNDRISMTIDKIRRKEITVINIRRQNKCTQECIDLIKEKKINADFMVTHRFDFEQTQEAFDLAAEYADGVVKAMIEI